MRTATGVTAAARLLGVTLGNSRGGARRGVVTTNGGCDDGGDDFGDYDGWPSDDGDVPAGGTDDDGHAAAKGMHEAATTVTVVAAALLAALVLAAVTLTVKTVPKMETVILGVMYLSVLVAAPMLLRLAYRENESRERSGGDDSDAGGASHGESE